MGKPAICTKPFWLRPFNFPRRKRKDEFGFNDATACFNDIESGGIDMDLFMDRQVQLEEERNKPMEASDVGYS